VFENDHVETCLLDALKQMVDISYGVFTIADRTSSEVPLAFPFGNPRPRTVLVPGLGASVGTSLLVMEVLLLVRDVLVVLAEVFQVIVHPPLDDSLGRLAHPVVDVLYNGGRSAILEGLMISLK
jgi:hypothetical protein